MTAYRNQLKAAIEATVIHSATTYSWFKKRSQPFSRSVRRALSPDSARGYLIFALQSQLYKDFYCKGFAQPGNVREAVNPVSGRTPFVESLANANAGCGYLSKDWEIREIEGKSIFVGRRGLSLWARPDEYIASRDVPLAAGDTVDLRYPKESLDLSPGFYLAHGNEELVREDDQTVVRLYWNLSPAGAVLFMQKCTGLLNRSNIAFKLKVLNEPAQFDRCDAVVLYIQKADYRSVSQVLSEVLSEVAGELGLRTPVFTKPIFPGVGLAEDPVQGESFGLHRCGLVAEGIVAAHELGRHSISQRLKSVDNSFAKENIRPDRPYLNPGSIDDYGIARIDPGKDRRIPKSGFSSQKCEENGFLDAALSIGEQLIRDAVWHGDRCNWLGAEPEGHVLGGVTQMTFKALGPELYSGTSGVAVFLAELHAATGNSEARRTALGAIRQAVTNFGVVSPSVRSGLYSGWSGIAVASAKVGTVLQEEELLDRAHHLLQRLSRESPRDHEYDLLSGVAGAIASLTVVQSSLPEEPFFLDFAEQLAHELLDVADKSETGCSWISPAFPDQPNLTGFSHGAAGIGNSLMELFGATGNSEYLRAAEKSFAFERSLFDENARNWPDLRTELGQPSDPQLPRTFATAWCHGAPGIALSRLRAFQLTKDETYKKEALVALETTRESVAKSLRAGTANYTLCHGLAGNADILLQGFRILGEETVREAALPQAAASAGIFKYGDSKTDWPCGPGGEKPSLMVGLAGIGYFLLRLYNPTLPSVLIFHPDVT